VTASVGLALDELPGIRTALPAYVPRPLRAPQDAVELSRGAGGPTGEGAEARDSRWPQAPASRDASRVAAGERRRAAAARGAGPKHRYVALYERSMAAWLEQEPLALEAELAAAVHVVA
jgi:hypothetical protein